jgi:riboflavin biosynthesis pyrimidine reductase
VSASLALDPDARFFREPTEPPIVLTTEQALAEGRADPRLATVAEVRTAGHQVLDWPGALRLLRADYGCRTLLVEGGPTLNTQLVADDLLDELRLTIAPLVVGGASRRIVGPGAPAEARPFTLADLGEEDGFLFLRYVRDRH